MRDWINDTATEEIFFAYLSFSNAPVEEALCTAARDRGVKITFVLDSGTDTSLATRLRSCFPEGRQDLAPRMYLRGNRGGLGFAHNKVFMVNPNHPNMRIAFSSGNMSPGVLLHHENWNFITLPSASYFAQAHICMRDGMLEHARSKDEYSDFMRECRSQIAFSPETDIKTFFIPGDGPEATTAILSGISQYDHIWIAAHRFSYGRMINALESRLRRNNVDMRLVVDDDMYWAGRNDDSGNNDVSEYNNVRDLVRNGADARYVETNPMERYLHHNKFILFTSDSGANSALFCGAGNLTTAAFTDNFENFYFITNQSVVDRYVAQYLHLWNDLATTYQNLPTTNVKPVIE